MSDDRERAALAWLAYAPGDLDAARSQATAIRRATVYLLSQHNCLEATR